MASAEQEQTRRGLATASLILGLAGMLGLGFFAGIPAIISGHVAFSRARHRPERYGGRARAIAGFTLGYLSLAVGTAVMATLIAFGVPALRGLSQKDSSEACQVHLQKLATAARAFAEANQGRYPTGVAELASRLESPAVVVCPDDELRRTMIPESWATMRPAHISYDYRASREPMEEFEEEAVFRCPIHGISVLGNGSIWKKAE